MPQRIKVAIDEGGYARLGVYLFLVSALEVAGDIIIEFHLGISVATQGVHLYLISLDIERQLQRPSVGPSMGSIFFFC